MTEATKNTEAKTPAEPKEIIRGRMPMALVYLIRFGDTKDMSVADQASLFATTVGKITDIRKGNNFGYITESYKPTQADIDTAVERMKKHPRYDEDNVDQVMTELEGLELATPEEEAEFAAVKKANRAQSSKTKDGKEANAGGGNRSGSKSEETDAEDLLA